MPDEQAKITFYSIDRCGYYRHGQQDAEFGDNVGEILRQIQAWTDGIALNHTCTYEEDDERLKTYCFNMLGNRGRYLLVTWNEIANTDGSVAVVSGDEPVGQATVAHIEAEDPNAIPGYPTYFYFIPTRRQVATIQFGNRLNGQQNMVKYLQGFLERFSDHAIRFYDDNRGFYYYGYRETPTSNAVQIRPKFSTSLCRNPGKLDEIRERRNDIRKLSSRTALSYRREGHISLFQRLLAQVGLRGANEDRLDSVNFMYEIDFHPTEDELESIINDWNNRTHIGWEDVGFKMRGEAQPLWLGKSLARTEYTLNIDRVNDEILDVESVLNALIQNEEEIFRLVEL